MTNVRRMLSVLLLGVLVLPTGCSWFKKGKKDVVVEPAPVTQPAAAAGNDLAVPTSAEPEGPRPGDLLPFPELQLIYFDYDSSAIRPDQMPAMEQNLKYLIEHPEDKVLVTGHCDERGTVEYNFNLGLRRARTIRDYFVQGGVDVNRTQILSRGEEMPVALGHNEEAWSKNRRSEFQRMF